MSEVAGLFLQEGAVGREAVGRGEGWQERGLEERTSISAKPSQQVLAWLRLVGLAEAIRTAKGKQPPPRSALC